MHVLVLEAMEDIQTRRSPQTVKKYDNDLQRVRAMQQLQADQEAKTKAKELKDKKSQQPAPEKKEVAVIPSDVTDSLAELAARAEALAESAEDKLRAAS